MKTLYILRHAKSSWDDASLSDFERPLNERGEKAAPFMGEFMRENGFVPDVIVSSPAERARMTAQSAKEAGEFDAEIRFDERIYEASPNALLYVVGEIEDEFETAMIVGHNPGFENLSHILSGESNRMPTAALAVIEMDIESWKEISPNCGKLRKFVRPKEVM